MKGFEENGVERVLVMEFVRWKFLGEFRCFDGECFFEMGVKDYFVWSDYFDLSFDGKISDLCWFGYCRVDGKVFVRVVNGRKIS